MERRRVGRGPPHTTVGVLTILVTGLIGLALYMQFRGDFTPRTKLTLIAARAGLVLDPGSKVTYKRGPDRPGVQYLGPLLVMDTGASLAPYYTINP